MLSQPVLTAMGDILCTINNNGFIKGRQGGLPILYSKTSTQRTLDGSFDRKVFDSQTKGMGTRIGFYTNVGLLCIAYWITSRKKQ
jgi:hypothetical protein